MIRKKDLLANIADLDAKVDANATVARIRLDSHQHSTNAPAKPDYTIREDADGFNWSVTGGGRGTAKTWEGAASAVSKARIQAFFHPGDRPLASRSSNSDVQRKLPDNYYWANMRIPRKSYVDSYLSNL